MAPEKPALTLCKTKGLFAEASSTSTAGTTGGKLTAVSFGARDRETRGLVNLRSYGVLEIA